MLFSIGKKNAEALQCVSIIRLKKYNYSMIMKLRIMREKEVDPK